MIGNSLFVQTSDVTVTSTSESSLISTGVGDPNLPANFLYPSRTLSIIVRGFYSTTLVPGTLTLKIKMGSTVVASGVSTAVLASSLSNKSFSLAYTMTCRTSGASGTVVGEGDFRYSATGGTLGTDGIIMTSPATIDTTVSQLLDVRLVWSLTGNSITIPIAFIQAWN